MKPKLLVLTSTFPRWLNDTDPPFVYELSRRLTVDFDVAVLAPHFPGAKTYEEMDGIRVHRFRYFFAPLETLAGETGILPTLKRNRAFYFLVPFFMIGQFVALLALIRRFKPDVIHAHWLIPQGFLAALAGLTSGIPYVVTVHGGDLFGLRGYFFKKIKGFVFRRAKSVTVVSKSLQDEIVAEFSFVKKIDIIPMGVSSSHFSPQQEDRSLREKLQVNGPLLLFAGRLTEKKGVIVLVEAMSIISDKFPDCRLVILGSGEEGAKLQQQANRLDLSRKIIFCGAVPNLQMPSYFASADVFIAPSIKLIGGDTEGFGLTIVEAAMSGCPVIASDVGGIGDIIIHNETGLLVPPGQAKLLAEALIYSLNNREHMKRMAESARKRCVRKFDWNEITEQYSKIIRRTCGKG